MVEKTFAFAFLLLLGCAASVPSDLPPTSPAAESAQPATVANVGVALREDPPLPGEKSDRWAGLPPTSGDDMSGMHMEHGGMGNNMDGGHDGR